MENILVLFVPIICIGKTIRITLHTVNKNYYKLTDISNSKQSQMYMCLKLV